MKKDKVKAIYLEERNNINETTPDQVYKGICNIYVEDCEIFGASLYIGRGCPNLVQVNKKPKHMAKRQETL